MKKHHAKKLRLDRETLVPLQDDALAAIAGGLTLPPPGTTTILSRFVCPPSLPLCVGK